MMAKPVGIFCGLTLKCTAKTTESGSIQQYQQNVCKHLDLQKLGLLVTDCLLIIKEDVQTVCLDSSWRHRRNHTLVTILLPPRLTGGFLPRFTVEGSYRAVARCWITDYDLFMVHVTWCSTTFYSCSPRILKQRVSVSLDTARWTNSIACSFPWLNP
jgi:hypothetical protein